MRNRLTRLNNAEVPPRFEQRESAESSTSLHHVGPVTCDRLGDVLDVHPVSMPVIYRARWFGDILFIANCAASHG